MTGNDEDTVRVSVELNHKPKFVIEFVDDFSDEDELKFEAIHQACIALANSAPYYEEDDWTIELDENENPTITKPRE